jgi:putative NIF3 family GTP cyclohydrolase 1 type 2
MNNRNWTRRDIGRFAAAGLFAAGSVLHGQQRRQITARDVVERIRQNVGIPWRSHTCDTFKWGDPDAPITGITCTFMSTLGLLQRSAAAGDSFVISHEPTFWTADDGAADFRDDPLFALKMGFIEKNKMVVWRFHDHWHAHKPDGIFAGWTRRMGWEKYQQEDNQKFVIPETTLEALVKEMQTKLNIRSIRVVGDPKLKVTSVVHGGHYIAQTMAAAQDADVVVGSEVREWETVEYFRDAVGFGQKKALIALPHEGGEEAGMEECAIWLRGFVSEVPVQFIASGDPFWIPSTAKLNA